MSIMERMSIFSTGSWCVCLKATYGTCGRHQHGRHHHDWLHIYEVVLSELPCRARAIPGKTQRFLLQERTAYHA